LKEWLEEYAPRVYRFARRLTGDPHTAADIAQETLLRAWRRRGELRNESAARTWLFAIAANLWRDHLRRGQSAVARAGPITDKDRIQTRTPDQQAAASEEITQILLAMEALPSRQQQVLYLNACEDLSLTQIARVVGISQESAKANLFLARKKMREMFPDAFKGRKQSAH
jgi:RNA polymerase sigma-70 factor (ECF subfamily)